MTQTTTRPAQLAPVRIGNGVKVHLGNLSSIKGPNGEPRYVSRCPASTGLDGKVTAGEAITEQINCRSCQREGSAEALQRAADAAHTARTAEEIEADCANPRNAAQQAQIERWLVSHDGASIPQATAADEVDAYAADGFMTASPPVAIQSIDLTGAICMDTKVHPRHRIIGSFRGSCSGIPGAKTQSTAIQAALPNREYDHNDECIGCGAGKLLTEGLPASRVGQTRRRTRTRNTTRRASTGTSASVVLRWCSHIGALGSTAWPGPARSPVS